MSSLKVNLVNQRNIAFMLFNTLEGVLIAIIVLILVVEDLSKRRQPMRTLEAVYFLHPTRER